MQILALRSACPAAEGRDLDLETARALIEDPAAYAAALLAPMRSSARPSIVSGQTSTRQAVP
jgi:hypothetical protein